MTLGYIALSLAGGVIGGVGMVFGVFAFLDWLTTNPYK
jgi:hypothetical protein